MHFLKLIATNLLTFSVILIINEYAANAVMANATNETQKHVKIASLLNENKNEFESDLITKLFSKYNNKLRPAGTVQIKLELNLIQIINIIEKDQIMVINAFVDHKWFDKRLSWDPNDFGNLTLIRIQGEKIWTPDTFIYTTADRNGLLSPSPGSNFVVNHKGEIFWPNPLNNLRVRCRMDILWFPFDEQICAIVFGSWSYSLHYLNYSLKNENTTVSLESYTENNVWQLVKFKPFRIEVKYEAWIENDSFSEVIYKILVRRKPLFVLQNSVIPALMLSILSLVSFFIPFAPKMQIGISIMLAFSVFKLRLSDDVPVQSDIIPLINVYFTLCMTFSLSCMVWFSLKNILIEKKRAPAWIRCIVLNYIFYILLLNFRKKYAHKNRPNIVNKKVVSQVGKTVETPTQKVINSNLNKRENSNNSKMIDEKKSLLIRVRHRNNSNSSFDLVSELDQLKKINLKEPIEVLLKNEKSNTKKPKLKSLHNHHLHHHHHQHHHHLQQHQSHQFLNRLHHSLDKSDFELHHHHVNRIQPPAHQSRPYIGNEANMANGGLRSPSKQKRSLTPASQGAEILTIKHEEAPLLGKLNSYKKQTLQAPSEIQKKALTNANNKNSIDDLEVIEILNIFIFILFLIFITSLNVFCLFILPYFFKKPLTIYD